MVFTTMIFIVLFLPITTAIYFLIPEKKIALRNALLLIVSVIFYSWGEPINLILLLLSIGITYTLSFGIADKNKGMLIFAIAANMFPLAVFKYLDFFIININQAFHLHLGLTHLALPIGISFYTFQILTYIIDLYKGKVSLQKNPAYLALYVFLFPQLIAGPIVRYSDVEREISSRHSTWQGIYEGVRRFVLGMIKKMIFANQAGYVVSRIQSNAESSTALMWVAVISYGVQILFDFSGYSDMAIGLGKIYGFSFPENFNRPYISQSVTEFWRRWHMTLSGFFRDYVYIPMGGNRVSSLRRIFNLFTVWFLTGLWHGASWNFIFWGLYYFVLLILEKYVWGGALKHCKKWFQKLTTLFFIMLGWGIFMTETNSLSEFGKFLRNLFGFYNPVSTAGVRALGIQSALIITALGLILSISTVPQFTVRFYRRHEMGMRIAEAVVLIPLFVVCVLMIAGASFNPFIYFRF